MNVRGHGWDKDSGGPRAQRTYFCNCGFNEGNSPTLAEARGRHQAHLSAVQSTQGPEITRPVTPYDEREAKQRNALGQINYYGYDDRYDNS
jgi:hypothetical protein